MASTTLDLNEKRNRKFDGNLAFTMGEDWIMLDKPSIDTIVKKENLLNIFVSPLFKDSRVLVIGEDSLYYAILALQKGADLVDIDSIDSINQKKVDDFINDENLKINLISEVEDYNDYDFVINTNKNEIERNEIDSIIINLYDEFKIFYPSDEIEAEYTNQDMWLPIFDIFILMSERNLDYTLLRNWEILTDSIDEYEDMTIDAYMSVDAKRYFEKMVNKLELINNNGWLIQNIEINDEVTLKLNIINSDINEIDTNLLNVVKNQFDYEDGIKVLNDKTKILYAIYYVHAVRGGINENIHDLISSLIESQFVGMYEWKVNNYNDILKYYYSNVGDIQRTTPINDIPLYLDKDYTILHNYYDENEHFKVYSKGKDEYRESSPMVAQKDIFVLESNGIETKIVEEKSNSILYKIQSSSKQVILDIFKYINDLFSEDWKKVSIKNDYLIYSQTSNVVILGMHRSGTSLTSSIIEQLGVNIGTYMLGQNSSNPNGHFEDQEFINLNELILHEAGGSWNNPPNRYQILDIGNKLSGKISNFIKKKQINCLWSWKDPRTILTYDVIKEYLINPKLIIVKREKADVVKSLMKREEFSQEVAEKLHDEYIERLNTIQNSNDHIIIEYNNILSNIENELETIINYLGLSNNHYELDQIKKLVKPNSKLKNGNLEAARILTDVNKAIISGKFNIALEGISNLIDNTKSGSNFHNLEYLKAFCLYQLGRYKDAFLSAKNETIINPENEKAFELLEKIKKYLPDTETSYSLPIEISIIVDHSSSATILDQCLKSIKKNTTGYNYELILLNRSNNITEEEITEKYDLSFTNLIVLSSGDKNLSKLYNHAISKKKGEHIIIISSEITVSKFWVQPLLEEIKKGVGLAGSLILYKDTNIIHHYYSKLGTKDGSDIKIYDVHKYHKLDETSIKSKEIQAVKSEVVFISNVVLEAGIKFDERINSDFNKVDLSLTIGKNGFKVKSIIESKNYIELQNDTSEKDEDLQYIDSKWSNEIKLDESAVDTTLNQHRNETQKDINYMGLLNKKNDWDISNDLINPTEKIDFSIIIPVHNNLKYTQSCIENIYKTSALYAIEVIIIDNASDSDTATYLESLGDQVVVITNKENNSFSKVNNQGGQIARGQYLVFLNNDVDVKPGWLESLEAEFKRDSDIGVQGGMLLYPSELVQHAGVVWGPVAENLNLHFHVYLTAPAAAPQVNISREYQMVTGALLCIKNDLFREIGGFDEKYYFGHEDLDLCLSARQKGQKVWYNSNVVAIHHESITKKTEGIEKFERFISNPDSYDAKNHKYFLEKWNDTLKVDSLQYYLEDRMYGLLGDLDKYNLFEIELKQIFDLLQEIPEEEYQEKASAVSEILFFRTGVDFVKNPGLLLNVQYDLLVKAKQFLNGENTTISKPKILITMFGWNESGGGTILPKNMAKDLVKRGYDVSVFYAGLEHERIKDPYYLDVSEDEGVKLYGIFNRDIPFINLFKPEKEIRDSIIVKYFEELLDDFKPDFVHYQNFLGLSFDIARLVSQRGIYSSYIPYNYYFIDPSLYMINSNLEKWDSVDKYKNSELIKNNPELIDSYKKRDEAALVLLNEWVNNIQAVSTRVKDIFVEFGVDPNRISVINQISKFSEKLNTNKDRFNHKPIRFGFLGGIMPHKGVHNIIAASSALKENSCEIVLYGFINDNYKEILESINTKIHVEYKGEYDSTDMNNIRDSIDVAILPSIWEDCGPHVISECLAMGLPIIAPNIGGFSDYIENGKNGFIYNYDNINSLAEIMVKLINDEELLNKLKDNSELPYGYQDYLDIVCKFYEDKPELNEILNYQTIFKEQLKLPSTEINTEKPQLSAMNRDAVDSNISGGFSNRNAKGKLPENLPSPLKINLGCGNDIREGFLNLDLFSDNPNVIFMDVRKLQFEDNTVDMILASDVLEHFSHREIPDILNEWSRVLKPDGALIIRCPNLRLQIDAYVRGDWNAEIASYMIFGGQTNPGDYHAVGFDEKSIEKYLKNAGLDIETIENEDFPQNNGYINLNMSVKARKSNVNNSGGEFEDIKKQFEENKKEFDKSKEEKGPKKMDAGEIELNIVWEGSQMITHSLALINREICYNIINSENSNLSIIPYEDDELDPNSNSKLSLLSKYDVRNKAPVDEAIADLPYVWIRHQWPPKEEPPIGAKWILMQPWEFTNHIIDFVEIYKDVDEIWTPSNYSRNSFINSGIEPNKVQIIPNGINPELFTPEGNKYNLKTTKKIKFLFIGGSIMRKGIDILLNVYLSLFKPTDDVCLVIKDIGSNSFYEGQNMSVKIEELKNNIDYPEIEYIDQNLSDAEMADLYRACDVFVSPYRGEGFCLPALEAMACGVPVVVTEGGSTDDFVDETCGWLIPSKYKVIGDSVNGKKTVGEVGWLNPNPEILGFVLQDILINPSKLFSLGLNASFRARKYWTWRNSTLKVFSRLDYHYNTNLSKKGLKNLNEYSDKWLELAEAETLYNEGFIKDAVKIFSNMITSDLPDDIKIYSLNVLILYSIDNQDLESAKEYIAKAKLIDTTDVDLIYLDSRSKVLENSLDEALEILNPLVEKWSENKWKSRLALTLDELISFMGDIVFDMGDIKSAIEIYEQALHHNPSNSNAMFGAAMCFKANEETQKAIEMLESILEFDENYEPAIAQLEEISQEA